MSSASRRPVGFLDMPLEIHDQIYRYCLVRENRIWLTLFDNEDCFNKWRIYDEKKSLLLVSKMIGFEALRLFYGDNVFLVILQVRRGYELKKHFAEANLRRIRKIQLVMLPGGPPYGHMPDSTFWSAVFAGLTKLSIIAQQPLEALKCPNAPSLEQEMEEWMK